MTTYAFVEIYFEIMKSISKIFVGYVRVGAVGAITPAGSELSPIDIDAQDLHRQF